MQTKKIRTSNVKRILLLKYLFIGNIFIWNSGRAEKMLIEQICTLKNDLEEPLSGTNDARRVPLMQLSIYFFLSYLKHAVHSSFTL